MTGVVWCGYLLRADGTKVLTVWRAVLSVEEVADVFRTLQVERCAISVMRTLHLFHSGESPSITNNADAVDLFCDIPSNEFFRDLIE